MLSRGRSQLAQDRTKRITAYARMKERRIEVHRVAVTPSFFSHVKHSRSPQVADDTPHRALRQRHLFRDFLDSTAWLQRNMKQHGAVAGHQIEVCDEAPLI